MGELDFEGLKKVSSDSRRKAGGSQESCSVVRHDSDADGEVKALFDFPPHAFSALEETASTDQTTCAVQKVGCHQAPTYPSGAEIPPVGESHSSQRADRPSRDRKWHLGLDDYCRPKSIHCTVYQLEKSRAELP